MTSPIPPHQPPVLLWFRRDLRLTDQQAVAAAAQSGQPVIAVYILDDSAPSLGGASQWWLHHSLVSLGRGLEQMGSGLVLRRGDAALQILALAHETGASAVYTGVMPEPHERATDRAVAEGLGDGPCRLHRLRTTLLHDPHKVLTQGGKPYSVFTPFSKAFLRDVDVHPPAPAPRHLPSAALPSSDLLADWNLLPRIPWDRGIAKTWEPGEKGAARRLSRFVTESASNYKTERDFMARPGTSMLSPHLHWGEISPWQAWEAVGEAQNKEGVFAYRRELMWREFAAHLLWHHPSLMNEPLRTEFANFPWLQNQAALVAWQTGETGIPIVDAAMRALWVQGWMHNRARMIVASFLVKHLLISWQEGEAWFWDTLVDADLANNCVSWQWVAGCGADAAPFFRIFNPVLQGKKFDPEGRYVRQWVPEIARLPDTYLQEPWAAPAEVLAAANIILGKTYPKPIVDLAEGRARALAALASVPRRSE